MKNPYQEGSEAWSLFVAGNELLERQRTSPEGQDAAIDRHTAAFYHVGAALASALSSIARCMAEGRGHSDRLMFDVSDSLDERNIS
jgi:hypothetical protein